MIVIYKGTLHQQHLGVSHVIVVQVITDSRIRTIGHSGNFQAVFDRFSRLFQFHNLLTRQIRVLRLQLFPNFNDRETQSHASVTNPERPDNQTAVHAEILVLIDPNNS